MQSYFKRLMDISERVSRNIELSKGNVKEYKRWVRTGEILREVIEYAFNQATTEDLRNRVMLYWGHGCKLSDTMEDDRVDMNYESLRKSISTLSLKIYRKLGDMLLYYLEQGMVSDAYVEFLVKTNRLVLEDVMPVGVTEMLPEPHFNPLIDVRDCVAELEFLNSVTYLSIKDRISKLDDRKLSFVLAILKGQSGLTSGQKQKEVWGYLFGKQDLKQMINNLIIKGLISREHI